MTPLPPIVPSYTLAPLAGRHQAQEADPKYIICDASTVDQFRRIFKDPAGGKDYQRLEALSPKGVQQIIFVIPPVETEVLDWCKENTKKKPNTTVFARITRGKGIIKSYNSMRTVSYLDQQMIVSFADTLGRHVGGDLRDFPPRVNEHPRPHPADDEARLDVRLGSMIGCVEAILGQQANADILVLLRGDPIGSRFENLKSVPNSLAKRLSATSKVLTAQAAHQFPDVLDKLLNANTIGNSTQPQPHPPILEPRSLEWSDLMLSGKGYDTDPGMLASEPAPEKFSPSNTTIRMLADTNVHAQLRLVLLDLVNRLEWGLPYGDFSGTYARAGSWAEPG